MKRGKDDEKIAGPIFPRLHVNDTDKGGPRAPPRNKMALYEQLSIPSSQRFNHGVFPTKQTSNGNLVSHRHDKQGGSQEKNMSYSLSVQPPMPDIADELHAHQIDRSNLNTPLVQLGQKQTVGNEDDCSVPVFLHFGTDQIQKRMHNNADKESHVQLGPSYSSSSAKLRNDCAKDPKIINTAGSRQEIGNKNAHNAEVCISIREDSVKSATNMPCPEKYDGNVHTSTTNVSSIQENQDHDEATFGRLYDDSVHENRHADEVRLSHMRNEDKSDEASETSMVDSMPCIDISPDDVVGVIGQKHFWKARRAIVNQQRLFSLQVFELHRLIKVQRLIAVSPDVLTDGNFPLKTSIKASPATKRPIEYVLTPSANVKTKCDVEKPNHLMECSAENVVGKSTNNGQPSNYRPSLIPAGPDAKMPPWCFNPSSGQQWLVPVMSPSEGLIYKPYPGPAFMGTSSGSYGPYGTTLTYGIPPSCHPYPGLGPYSGFGQNFFPPYSMPVTNPSIPGSTVEQMSQIVGPGSYVQANFSKMDHESSCSVPTQSGAFPKFQVSRESDLQENTENGETRAGSGTEKGNELTLFPIAPASKEGGPSQFAVAAQPTRVIKVVPHNPISATESAARIFRSIQQERKQNESL